MKRIVPTMAALMIYGTCAFADDMVTLTATANMQSYRDPSITDKFTATITDKQVDTQLKIECQAGVSGLISGQDEACSVSGNGRIINPANKQAFPRTQYAGGFVVKPDGYTDGSSLSVNYLAIGKVPASSAGFSGNLVLKPENPSSGSMALKDTILGYIKGDSKNKGVLIDERVDTVQLSNFQVPSAGLPSDKGCIWNGNMAFSYQTESWFIDVTAMCNGKPFQLKGNMPWTETTGASNQTQYDLNLVMPSATVTSDEALFANPEGDTDLFAAADGMSGQIIMKESGYVNTMVDGKETKVASNIEISGSFTGHNVPLETVRSFSTIVFVMSRTFFGA
jgi:hypothetical protein